MKKFAIIGTVGLPARYGGFETMAHYLTAYLSNVLDITVYCSGRTYKKEERLNTFNGAKLHYINLNANGVQSIFYDFISILHALKHSDILFISGVSGCWCLPFVKMFSNKKIIVNIDGCEWRRSKWNWFAKMFLLLGERYACNYSDEIVTDNRILKEYVKIRYNRNSRLIEYGADHISEIKIAANDYQEFPFLRNSYAFKVARIEPENNVHVILEAVSKCPELTFVIVGNWEYSTYGQRLKRKYSSFDNIHIYDPIYNLKKLDLLRSNANLYIHGHSAGGTNPSLVEAMYHGLPILSYDAIYNRITTNNQALYFNNTEQLIELIDQLPETDIRIVADNMKNYAEKRYTWKAIAARYYALTPDEIEEAVYGGGEVDESVIIEQLEFFKEEFVDESQERVAEPELVE